MSDKLSRLQSYSLNRKAGNIKFVKLKEVTKKKDKIDERIAAIKRDTKITFTGRENEISQLRHIYFSQKKKLTVSKELKNKFSQNEAPPVPAVIGIKGEAGIGKSRLISEFLKSHIKNSIPGVSDTHVQNPYSFFISLIKSQCVISDSDTPDEVKHKLKFSLQDLSNYEKGKPDKKNLIGSFNLLCHLLGIYSKDYRLKLPASELKIHLQLCIKNFIEAVAAKINFNNEPLIIVCEDAHWMDDTSRNTLSYLFNTLNINSSGQYRSIIFLMLYRPEFKVMKDAELKADFTEIEIEPLDYNSVQKILRSKNENKTGKENLKLIPDETIKLLTERSEGNPLFIQEWIRMFGDRYTSEELRQIKSSGLRSERENIEIPVSINLLINKRLERLSVTELSILQYASVIGNEFTDTLLKKTAKLLSDETDIGGILEKLADNRFIRKSDKTFGSDRYYEFHHDVIREVVYETIPEDNRKIIHKTAGEAIENIFHGRIEQYYYVLCEHFEKGGAEEKLIDYLEKAGDSYTENFENEKAIEYYDKLLKLEKDKSKKFEVLFKKLRLMKLIGKWNESASICKSILKDKLKQESNEYLKLNLYLAENLFCLSRFSQSIKILRKLISILQKQNYNELSEESLSLICLNYIHCGMYNNALKSVKLIQSLHEGNPKKDSNAKVFDFLGQIYFARGDFKESLKYYEKSMNIYSEQGDQINTALLYNRIGTIYFNFAEYGKAKLNYEKALHLHKKTGNILGCRYALGNIGNVYNNTGRMEEAFKYYNEEIKISKQTDNKEGIASSFSKIGNYHIYKHDYEKAILNYEQALEIYKNINRKRSIANTLSNIGLINFYKGNYGTALEYYEEQNKINDTISNKEGLLRGYLNTGNLHKSLNNFDSAKKYYKKAIKLSSSTPATGIFPLLYFNLAELFFEAKHFDKAETYNSQAMKLSGKEDHVNNKFEYTLLSKKICFYREHKKISFDLNKKKLILKQETLKQIFNEVLALLKETKDETLIASVHFELWKMSKLMKEQKQITDYHQTQSRKLYNRLYKQTPNIEYKSNLNLLN